ncbi:uncharacterized protein [Bemisia tabaci]|uniref:uncharacterized protein n=1 Tax=Bemisia tabaci TaxID=7038 RepID=UPI003B28D6FF
MGDQLILYPMYSNIKAFNPSDSTFEAWYQLFEEFCMAYGVPEEPAPAAPAAGGTRNQSATESISEFISAIQDLAAPCDFGEHYSEAILDRFVAGIRNKETQQKLISMQALTFESAKTKALQLEAIQKESRALAQAVATSDSSIHHTNSNNKKRNSQQSRSNNSTQQRSNVPDNQHKSTNSTSSSNNGSKRYGACHRCGKPHNVNTCPAINYTCDICGIKSHVKEVCRQASRQQQSKKSSPDRSVDNRKRTNAHQASVNKTVDDEVDELLYVPVNYIHEKVNSEICGRPSLYSFDSQLTCDPYNSKSHMISVRSEVNSNSHVIHNSKVHMISARSKVNSTSLVVHSSNISSAPLTMKVLINKVPIEMEIDSGAGASIMHNSIFRKSFANVVLTPSSTVISSITGTVQVEGQANMLVESSGNNFNLPLVVHASEQKAIPLMGRLWLDSIFPNWRKAFDLTMFSTPEMVANIHEVNSPSVDELKSLFPRTFNTIADTVIEGHSARLLLKDSAIPVFDKAYTLPFGLIEPVNTVLNEWEKSGKVVRIRQAEWASPVVAVEKKDSGGVRVCTDFKRTLNPQLRVDQYPLPRPDDLFANLAGGVIFTSLYLKDAYTQLKLHPDSQDLCVLNTHRGLNKPSRLMYGVASGAPIFQCVMDQTLFGIPGTQCFIDNILIQGKNLAECVHPTLLVLGRLDKHNVRLSLPKCHWFVTQIEHLGFIISKEGRSPAPSLTSAVVNYRVPTNGKEVRSFLGMIGFYSDFLPQFSTVARPLRDLCCKNTVFEWSSECEAAFQKCKELLVSNSLLIHYDPALPLVVYSDASPVGVGATLSHTVKMENGKPIDRPVAYASSTLTQAQRNYAQHDREGLSVVYAVTKFHRFIWGRPFKLYTDNSAIQRIFNPDKGLPTRTGQRLQHCAVLLQAYNFEIVHRKSEFMATADALSRLPAPNQIEEVFHVELSPNLPIDSSIIALATQDDVVLSKVF